MSSLIAEDLEVLLFLSEKKMKRLCTGDYSWLVVGRVGLGGGSGGDGGRLLTSERFFIKV